MGSADSDTMRAFIIAALAAVVAGDAKPYTVGQVLAGATHGGVITSTTYHGGLKVAGFPHVATALVPAAVGYAAPVVYGKREAEPYTVGQVLAGHTAGGVILHHLCRRTQDAWFAPCPHWLRPPSRLRQEGGGAPVLPVPQPWSPCHNQPCPRGGCHPPRSHPLFQRGPLHQLRRSCCPLPFFSLKISWTRINW